MASGREDFVMVAAIDFGTTFSGYAFSFASTKDNPELPEQIRTNNNWGASLGFQSNKTPTSVLTTKSGDFLAFGHDAERKYSEALDEDEDGEPDMLLFRHFKMMLHNREKLKLSATIAAVDGTIMPAMDIFVHALSYLKDHLLQAIRSETKSEPLRSLVRWVITVPAIWSEESKQFMRKAAYKADYITELDSTKLVIALEPEAASLCCRRLNIARYADNNDVSFPVGTKYLVLDCGGGTVDITVHVTEAGKKVKELLHASGGSWGGTQVDRNFVNFIESVLGKNFLNIFRKQCPQEWLHFLTNFERVKKSFSNDEDAKITLSIPYSMAGLYASINKGEPIDKVLKAAAKEGIGFKQGTIIIKYNAAKLLFEPVINMIIQHVRNLLRDPRLQGLQYILMVGGFSECQVLHQTVRETFSNGIKVLKPAEAEVAVLKGAVLYGHAPDEIAARIAKKTYACEVDTLFDATKHDRRRRCLSIDGNYRCTTLKILVKKGTEISVGSTSKYHFPLLDAQTEVGFRLYSTEAELSEEITYPDDPCLDKLGEIAIRDLEIGRGKKVELRLHFGNTEIQVEAVDLTTNKRARTVIDFLSK